MTVRIETGDCREVLKAMAAASVDCCVTSPPYFGMRDYGHSGQIGLELTPEAFVAELVSVFREVRRVLRDTGTLWLNLGDSFWSTQATQGRNEGRSKISTLTEHGADGRSPYLDAQVSKTYQRKSDTLKPKDLIGIPWRAALALQSDGWYLRSDIVWNKPNAMPDAATDRPTKSHEYVFLLAKSARYYYDAASIAEPSDTTEKRNKRSVWDIATQPYPKAHFATFPPDLIEPCIKAGCPVGGTVLDPFGGAGTTGLVADRLQRNAILIELNPAYAELAKQRIVGDAPLFAEVST